MLKIQNVSYAYAAIPAVQDVSLDIQEGEIICLLGPSGCGKTTLLRIIAGLEKGYAGGVIYDGRDIARVPVHERDFGLMFQDFALFPHMSVADNVAYGLKRQGKSKHEIAARVEAMLARVGLLGYENRDVNMLSGGQKQRVALARSLAPNPRLLMLDEPLGSLDALLREQLIIELKEIVKSVGLTSVYVTHDQKEAYAIADRVVIMNAGQIEQVDTPQNMYHKPKTAFVASFLGLLNVFDIATTPELDQLITLARLQVTDATHLLIHPVGISIADNGSLKAISVDAVIESILFRGEYFQLELRLDNGLVLNTNVLSASDFAVGHQVQLQIQLQAFRPLS